MKGHTAWNKGLKGIEYTKHYSTGMIPWNKGLTKGTNKRLKELSELMTGRKLSEDHKKSIIKAVKGNTYRLGTKCSKDMPRIL